MFLGFAGFLALVYCRGIHPCLLRSRRPRGDACRACLPRPNGNLPEKQERLILPLKGSFMRLPVIVIAATIVLTSLVSAVPAQAEEGTKKESGGQPQPGAENLPDAPVLMVVQS